jgi:hypothetical protein
MDRNLDYLLSEFRDRMGMLGDALSTGNLASYEDYKYVCGQLRGLEAACAIVADLKQRTEEDFDE